MNADGTATSKWGTFPLYKHALAEVPAEYGEEVRFFETPSLDEAFVLFRNFAADNGLLDADIGVALHHCSDLWKDETLT